MEWSLSKVMRIEKGEVNISAGDLRMLLAFLDVTDPADVNRLLADARTARRERWSADPRYREHLTPALLQMIQFEQVATRIRHYGSVVVPGLLQTQAYAEAIFRNYEDELDAADIATRVEARLSRQQLLHRPDPPEYLLALDEAVLWRPVGGEAVMAAQLEKILQIIAETTILVRVVPFAAAASALFGPFTIFDLDPDQTMLYRESYTVDEIVSNPKTLARHEKVFDQLWSLALDDQKSVQLIKDRAAEMTSAARG